jgi:transcriptional regulator with XRE-family HTH domain
MRDGYDITLNVIGERIRRVRTDQGLTLRAVAETAGVSPGTVQKIEAGRLVPSIQIFMRVAAALGRRASYFLGDEDGTVELRVIRRGGGRVLPTRSRMRISAVAETLHDPKMEAYLVELPAQARSGRPLGYRGELLFYCLRGGVKFWSRGRTETIRAGDTLHLKADIPHHWQNPTDIPAEMLVIWAAA